MLAAAGVPEWGDVLSGLVSDRGVLRRGLGCMRRDRRVGHMRRAGSLFDRRRLLAGLVSVGGVLQHRFWRMHFDGCQWMWRRRSHGVLWRERLHLRGLRVRRVLRRDDGCVRGHRAQRMRLGASLFRQRRVRFASLPLRRVLQCDHRGLYDIRAEWVQPSLVLLLRDGVLAGQLPDGRML